MARTINETEKQLVELARNVERHKNLRARVLDKYTRRQAQLDIDRTAELLTIDADLTAATTALRQAVSSLAPEPPVTSEPVTEPRLALAVE